ncbi:MAG: hypothetical protein HQM11_07455 [SAR324 cluster bacterium]|nr:hypothetical protein [SAR324 cluster bacterium]
MMKKTGMLMLAGMLCLAMITAPRKAEAAQLKIVFENALWGAAIGGVVGLALWGLSDGEKVEKISGNVIRGAALGGLLGIGYGVYQLKGKNFSQNSLLEYSADKALIAFRPTQLLPQISKDQETTRFDMNVFALHF